MTEESDASELARLTAEIDELARYADAQEQKVRQLEGALESRVVIERAVGMLDPERAAPRVILDKYEAFETSGLEYEVVAGDNNPTFTVEPIKKK